MTTQVASTQEQTWPAIFYEEPGPIEDGMQQEPIINLLIYMLRDWFKGQRVMVGAGGFLSWNRLNGNERISPDGFITLDMDPDLVYQFPNYLIWEIGKPPDVVMEVASPSTAENDLGSKRDRYARLGISEYWKFDPTGGELYGVALMGERLVDDEYVAYELNIGADGSVWSRSEVLGLDFSWDGIRFDILDPLTRQTLNTAVIARSERTRAELAEELAESERTRAERAEERADSERTRAERAEERADSERTRAEQERTRADSERQARLELEAELRRLKDERQQDEDNERQSPS